MTIARRIFTAAALAAAVLVAGVLPFGGQPAAASPAAAAPAAAPLAAAPLAAASAAAAPPAVCDETDLGGCYTYAQTREVFDYSVLWIRQAAATVAPGSTPRRITYIPSGATAVSACPPPRRDTAAEYCAADATVYLGQDFLWPVYRDTGDLGPPIVLAHEWGHRIQHLAGILGRTGVAQVAVENQADCVAGAFARQLRAMGLFTEADVQDLDDIMTAAASNSADTERTHGTVTERVTAAHVGLDGGLDACNRYVPGATLR